MGREEQREGAARRVREKAENQETGQGVRRRAGGEQAFVPVLIFTAKASSWSGTRRSVQNHSSPAVSAITSSGEPSLWMEKQQRSCEPSVLEVYLEVQLSISHTLQAPLPLCPHGTSYPHVCFWLQQS